MGISALGRWGRSVRAGLHASRERHGGGADDYCAPLRPSAQDRAARGFATAAFPAVTAAAEPGISGRDAVWVGGRRVRGSDGLIGKLGAVPLAGHQIALNTVSLTYMVPLGIGAAAAVRVGQALGRGDRARSQPGGLDGAGPRRVVHELMAIAFWTFRIRSCGFTRLDGGYTGGDQATVCGGVLSIVRRFADVGDRRAAGRG